MIEVKEVVGKKMQKEFLEFPLKLYKNSHYYVPPLYGDEKKIFSKNYYYYEHCDAVYFNAYKDGEMVGRISGVIQKQSNEKNNEKRARFCRFDVINDEEVAKALFDRAEKWAIEQGMDTICGPLSFSDLEREGMLIDGFYELSTFEENYNYAYYPELVEKCGYVKDVDWFEFKVYPTEAILKRTQKLSEVALKRYNLHVPEIKSVGKFLNKYADQLFEVLDESYDNLYGTVPFTDSMKKNMLAQFKMVIKPEFFIAICDEKDNVVAFGLGMPSLAEAVKKSNGRLTPAGLCRLLKAINHPVVADLALIGIKPEFQKSGIAAVLVHKLINVMYDKNIEHCETNFCLENNTKIQQIWQLFETKKHKVRRAYVKKLI